ncbi:MAG: outer membrane lipoprotein carrier protein LolA [Bacteroidales bacterium]
MRHFILTILSLLLCIYATGESQQNNVKEAFDAKLAEYSTKNKTIECDFIHTRHLQKLTRDVTMRGKFYYNNTGEMALRYTEPKGNLILVKNGVFSMITAGKTTTAQGSSNPMLEQITNMIKACMTGDISQLGRGWNTNYTAENGKYTIELIPQDSRTKKYLAKIILLFNGTDMSLEKMIMQEKGENYSQYEFTHKLFNKAIDASKFELDN